MLEKSSQKLNRRRSSKGGLSATTQESGVTKSKKSAHSVKKSIHSGKKSAHSVTKGASEVSVKSKSRISKKSKSDN